MSDSDRRSDEPGLFDLPLRPEEEEEEAAEPPVATPRRARSKDLPLFPEADEAAEDETASEAPPETPRPRPVAAPEPRTEASRETAEPPAAEEPEPPQEATLRRATPGRRWLGGGLDVLTLLGVGIVLTLGTLALGGGMGWADMLPVALFLLLFSFVYTVIPLAFWGQTPGMIRAGLVARSGESDPLTFGQTALRWVGGLVTVATLGLPTLLVLFGGRSLTDRLSGSDTYQKPR